MKNSTVITVLAVCCFVLALTVAYLVGYQRGTRAMNGASPADEALLKTGKRGGAGPGNKPAPGQRTTFATRAHPPGSSGNSKSFKKEQKPVTETTTETISRSAEVISVEGQPTGAPGQGWIAVREGLPLGFDTWYETNVLARVEGTSTLLDWEARSWVISGTLWLGRNFPLNPAQASPGEIEARAHFMIPVRTFQLAQKDGPRLGSELDRLMYRTMLGHGYSTIECFVLTWTLAESAMKGGPLRFNAQGALTVAGLPRRVPVSIRVTIGREHIRFYGEMKVKMSDFNLRPPAWTTQDGELNQVADDVTLSLEWVVPKTQGVIAATN